MNGAGTLAQHFFQLFHEPLADRSWSDRRARLPWQVFAELMARMLRPRAHRRTHPEAFWRGWRLLALDGTQFSLTNTPQIKGALKKAKSRRGRAAFAKLTTGVLLEIGLHNPLAAAIGRQGQSEWELASLYAQRWEHELYYRQLKRQLRRSEVLQSHTVETAAQEIAALVLCSALLAAERARAAAGQVAVLRVSFVKVLELLQPLWLTLELGEDLLSDRQKTRRPKSEHRVSLSNPAAANVSSSHLNLP
jgi:hypothetical protein